MGWGPSAPDMTAANTAASSQAAIAQEQWDTTKAYLPKAMALADRDDARAQSAADLATSDSAFYRGVAQHQIDEAAKAEPFQQKMRDMATTYSSGSVGDADADRAGADVAQGYAGASGTLARSAGRMGINPSSGAFATAMTDMTSRQALDSAGAQTNARLAARNKAEALVAAAAGSGQAAFTNGMGAGGMAGGLGSGAVSTGGMGLQAMGGVQGTYNQGASSAAGAFGSASSAFRSNAVESAKSPGFDFVAGLATGGLKAAGAAGGFGNLVSGVSGLFSDRRLKTDIKLVGALDNGLGVYTFRYKSGGPIVMGVMADEVELVLPHAVIKNAGGTEFDAVDYAVL